LGSHLFCQRVITGRFILVSNLIRQARVAIQRDNRLDGKVRVVREVAGEIIRAKLIFGVESIVRELEDLPEWQQAVKELREAGQ